MFCQIPQFNTHHIMSMKRFTTTSVFTSYWSGRPNATSEVNTSIIKTAGVKTMLVMNVIMACKYKIVSSRRSQDDDHLCCKKCKKCEACWVDIHCLLTSIRWWSLCRDMENWSLTGTIPENNHFHQLTITHLHHSHRNTILQEWWHFKKGLFGLPLKKLTEQRNTVNEIKFQTFLGVTMMGVWYLLIELTIYNTSF